MSNLKEKLLNHQNLIRNIRSFFYSRNVVEVVTPSLLTTPTTDVYIDSIEVSVNQALSKSSKFYLHTSPELEMKRLLSKGSGDIFQICQVFRDNEFGRINSNEFTMLEFYRVGFDMQQLIEELKELLIALGKDGKAEKMSYAQAFFDFAGIDILNSDFEALKIILESHDLSSDYEWIEDMQMVLFVHLVEPKLKSIPVCFIYDFPWQQAALAQIDGPVAHRFEMYINGTEIANGYQEIQTSNEYRDRFQTEINKRKSLSKFTDFLDEDFLDDLKDGLPACSGVAIGIDRLFASLSL
ncbi:EF-P lysine aminoacylase EpmA [Pseudothioglobus sp. nBUS_23]|uniref:EF-P lysine aminoacylase EpmA n=1 Tax=Pseudothioglobus sp. nBUS_23 TaxID=3395318 RepID=UPI003EBF753B